MSSLGMCALFFSVTPTQANKSLLSNAENKIQLKGDGKIEKSKYKPSRSMSVTPTLTSYMSSPKMLIERYIYGIHPKTKRCLAEEAESGDDHSLGSWIRDGVDPNEIDGYGYTPLLNAAAMNRLNSVKELIKNGADVNKKGPFGFTPLHAAAQNGYREIVSVLLLNGADINAQNDDMDTPMHLAIRAARIETVYMLVRCGGNAKIEGYMRKDCVQTAKDAGLKDMANTLKNYNSSIGFHPHTIADFIRSTSFY